MISGVLQQLGGVLRRDTVVDRAADDGGHHGLRAHPDDAEDHPDDEGAPLAPGHPPQERTRRPVDRRTGVVEGEFAHSPHSTERTPSDAPGFRTRPGGQSSSSTTSEGQRDQQCDEHQTHCSRDDERGGAVGDDVEDQQHHPGDQQADRRERGRDQPVRGRDEALLDVQAGDPSVDGDRGDHQGRGDRGEQHEGQVEPALETVQVLERLLERQRQQETGRQLGTGLHDPQLLEELVPLAVETLGLGLATVGGGTLLGHPDGVPGDVGCYSSAAAGACGLPVPVEDRRLPVGYAVRGRDVGDVHGHGEGQQCQCQHGDVANRGRHVSPFRAVSLSTSR